MSFRPVQVGLQTTVEAAWKVMQERHIRHLPVVDAEHKLAGLVTQRDLLALPNFRTQGRLSKVHEVMIHIVNAVAPESCLFAAARFIVESKKSCLPVIDPEGRLLGLLTEADFVQHAADQNAPCKCEPQQHVGGVV